MNDVLHCVLSFLISGVSAFIVGFRLGRLGRSARSDRRQREDRHG